MIIGVKMEDKLIIKGVCYKLIKRNELPDDITSLLIHKGYVYISSGSKMFRFNEDSLTFEQLTFNVYEQIK